MDIKIVEYEERHKEAVCVLFDNFQDYLVNLDPIKRLRRMSGYAENVLNETLKDIKDNDGIFLLAEDDSKVIGFIVGKMEKRTEGQLLEAYPALMGRITELYVDSNYRSKGIGSMLMLKLENYFKKKNCEYVWVDVFKPNTTASNFYKKFDYEDRDIEMIKRLKHSQPVPVS